MVPHSSITKPWHTQEQLWATPAPGLPGHSCCHTHGACPPSSLCQEFHKRLDSSRNLSLAWQRMGHTPAMTFPSPLPPDRAGRGIIGPLHPVHTRENGSLSQFAAFRGKHIFSFFPSPNEYCKFQGLGEMSPARPDRALQKHFVTCCSHHGALTARHSRAHDSAQRMPSKPARPRLRFQVMEMPLSLRCRNVPNTLSMGM